MWNMQKNVSNLAPAVLTVLHLVPPADVWSASQSKTCTQNMHHLMQVLTADDLHLRQLLELETGTPVTPAPGNVHTNFGLCIFCLWDVWPVFNKRGNEQKTGETSNVVYWNSLMVKNHKRMVGILFHIHRHLQICKNIFQSGKHFCKCYCITTSAFRLGYSDLVVFPLTLCRMSSCALSKFTYLLNEMWGKIYSDPGGSCCLFRWSSCPTVHEDLHDVDGHDVDDDDDQVLPLHCYMFHDHRSVNPPRENHRLSNQIKSNITIVVMWPKDELCMSHDGF